MSVHEFDRSGEAEAERTAEELVRDLLDEAMAIAAEWGMQKIGDGEGGGLIYWMAQAYDRHRTWSQPFFGTPRPPVEKGRPPLSVNKRLAALKAGGYRCAACGTDENLTVDHIHPVSKGGSDDPENLQVLCKSCNSSKGARV